jgi:hypothetical protein
VGRFLDVYALDYGVGTRVEHTALGGFAGSSSAAAAAAEATRGLTPFSSRAPHFALLSFRTREANMAGVPMNIGDEMQQLAAAQFLPYVVGRCRLTLSNPS